MARDGGMTFEEGLTILFIGLKLAGKVDWAWWWVLCPLAGLVLIPLAKGLWGRIRGRK